MTFPDYNLKRLKNYADSFESVWIQDDSTKTRWELKDLLVRLEAAEEVIHVREHAWKTNYGEEKMEAWRKAAGNDLHRRRFEVVERLVRVL